MAKQLDIWRCHLAIGMGVGLGQDHIVLDGDNSLLKCKRLRAP